jgi:hypothetical protein
MDLHTFTQLLERYGTTESNWPAQVRDEAAAFVAANPEAQSVKARFRPLDEALDRYEVHPDNERLRAAILARIDDRPAAMRRRDPLDVIMRWLFPDVPDLRVLWRPALAASLPLLAGIIIGSTFTIDALDTTDSWDEEIQLLALEEPESLP